MNVWGGFYILLSEYVSYFINLLYTTWHSEEFWSTIFAFPLKVNNKENPEEKLFGRGVCTLDKDQEGSLAEKGMWRQQVNIQVGVLLTWSNFDILEFKFLEK